MSDSGDNDPYSSIVMVTSSGDNISAQSDLQSFDDSGFICLEDSVEVVISSDVAEETIVTTSNQPEINECPSTILHIPVDRLAYNTVELVDDGHFKQSLDDSADGLTDPDQRDDDIDAMQESYIALTSGSRSDSQLMKEITKRQKDKEYKREQRANPLYRVKEKEKARQRMKDRRKDPLYRQIERQRDSERRRQARRQNDEVRQRERERDKEYRRGVRQKNITKHDGNIGSLVDNRLTSHEIPPCHGISNENESDSLTVDDGCFSALDSCNIQSPCIWTNRNVLDSSGTEESDAYLKLSTDQDAVPD